MMGLWSSTMLSGAGGFIAILLLLWILWKIFNRGEAPKDREVADQIDQLRREVEDLKADKNSDNLQ